MKQKRYVLGGIIRVNVARTAKSLWEVNRTWERRVISELELPKASPTSKPPSLCVSVGLGFRCQKRSPETSIFLSFLFKFLKNVYIF